MKTGIHPTYHDDATITCACGNVITAGSVIKEQTTDVCSACHPFYTGKKTLVDTAGRVDRFKAKMAKAQELANKNAKGDKSESKDKSDDKYMTIDAMKALKVKEAKKAEKKAAKKEKVETKKEISNEILEKVVAEVAEEATEEKSVEKE